MSEKISKISVDGVVYDIASTGGGEVPGDIQEQLSALENKVTEEASAREEGDAKLSEKIESEASRVDGMVNQINENVASSIETLNNNLVQAIETINNGIAAEVTNREEGDAKLQAAIDELAEKVNGEGADLTELEGKIEKNAADIATVNNNLVEAVNNINKNVADGFSTINGGLNNEIRPELEKAVKYEDTATEQNPGRKTIFLNNHDNICGKTTDGSAVNIAMVSKWNKVDLGSSSVEINLNGSAERPTYNDTEEIALLKDVQGIVIPTKVSEFENDANYQSASQVDARIQEVVAAAPEALDTLKELADALGNDPDFAGTITAELAKKADKTELEGLATEAWVESKGYLTEHQDISGLATKEEVETEKERAETRESKLQEDLSYVADTVIPEMNSNTAKALDSKVSWDVSKKVISLPMDGSIAAMRDPEAVEGGVLLAQRSYDDNATFVTEVGTTKNNLTLNASERPQVDIKGADSEKIAYLSDVESLEKEIAKTVKFYIDSENEKVVTFDNAQLLNAKSNDEELENKVDVQGRAISLIQLNKWNVVDLGSPYTITNINTPKGQRPTVQEAGQSGPEANQIAYVSDVAGLSNTLEALNATVQILQSKVDVLTKTNTEVVSVDGSAGELKDSSKDYIVSGSINENAEIVGKSISLKSIKVSDNARLKLNAGDVEAKDLNISGSFPKANGNTVISVNNAEFIVFKDMVFDASEVYNGIEIGLASNSVLPKNILFDNCKFQGEFSNNAILVFGTQDNAIITLNNCYFEKISNALRLSNKSNASGVVVNINNCTVDQWETRAPWQGFLICEDYTNKTEEEVNANNLFGDGKITVNFNNLVHVGVKINPADPASVCGTKNESQVVMVSQDAVAGPEGDYCLSYDAAKFPVVSFK